VSGTSTATLDDPLPACFGLQTILVGRLPGSERDSLVREATLAEADAGRIVTKKYLVVKSI
jgi:hypothetical protein